MINVETLKARGLKQDDLKKAFTQQIAYRDDEKANKKVDKDSDSAKLSRWVHRVSTRISEGRDRCIADSPTFHAINQAFEVSLKQISPTLLHELLNYPADSSRVEDALAAYGMNLDEVITEEEIPITKENKAGKRKMINYPAFRKTMVPLVAGYTTIRHAKLINDRKLVPLWKYEPAINNFRTRTKCEVITSRIEVITRQMGSFRTMSHAELHALKYGRSLVFPRESWFYEEQEAKGETEDVTFQLSDDKKKRKVKTVKEGIRHHVPPPDRTYFDEAYPISTFNTDSGATYAGYHRVVRYGEIRDNPKFWNTDKVNTGPTEWWTGSGALTYFNNVYGGCTLNWPRNESGDPNDREKGILNRCYSADWSDKACVLTEHFEKVIPSEIGLGDYDYPVWLRLVMAGHDTVTFCEPLAYTPVIAYLYDIDESRRQNSSLSLEILPFQDQFSNLLTQYLITIKQNLTNVNFYDSNVKDMESFVSKIKGWGDRLIRRLNFFPIDGRSLVKSQTLMGELIHTHRMPYIDPSGIMTGMKALLDVLERVLVMSSQEVAQAASHELRAEEVRNISESASSRLRYTAIPLDEAIEAHKRQMYQGLMAYGDDNFYAEIPMDRLITLEELNAMGITFDEEKHKPRHTDKKMTVKVKLQSIMMESFSANRDGSDRVNNTEAGIAMFQSLTGLVASPLFPYVGPDQVIALMNVGAQLMGFPREFKLENVSPSADPAQQQAQQQAALQEMLQQVVQAIDQKIKTVEGESVQAIGELSKEVAKIGSVVKAVAEKEVSLEASVKQIHEAIDHLHALTDVNNPGSNIESGINPSLEGMAQPVGMS